MAQKKILKITLYSVITVIVTLILVLVIRVFFFSAFVVNSMSMMPTIVPGDKVLVYKMIPGPRIFTNWNFVRGGKFELQRIVGCRPIKRDEIVVFNTPYIEAWGKLEINYSSYYVKRCLAIPGDSISIVNGFYKVIDNNHKSYINKHQQFAPINIPEGMDKCFPFDSVLNWNIMHFGPLYIPRKGDILNLNTSNYKLYKHIIEFESKKLIDEQEGKWYLDGEEIQKYIFCKNYYFMGGDNFPNSIDSRYLGLIPEDFIVGKVLRVLWSKDKNKNAFRWNRLFKKLT